MVNRITKEAAKPETAQDRYVAGLHERLAKFIANQPFPQGPQRAENFANIVHETFLYQEIEAWASDCKKRSWAALQAGDKPLIDNDDELKSGGIGSELQKLTGQYALSLRVDPRSNFERDAFVGLIQREAELPASTIQKFVKQATRTDGTALTKRIILNEGKKK